jgi:hypothetical protein
MLREKARLQYRCRITDGNRAEVCGELPPLQGDETAIVVELAAVYRENPFNENRVKSWLHEIKLHRSDLSDRPNSGGPPLEDIDARIMQVMEAEPWFLLRPIAEFLKIPASTVHPHLISSLNMKSRHFKWVPHFLDDDLRAKRLKGARQLLDVLQAQERYHFRDLMTGDEIQVCLDMKPGIVWLPADVELPVRVKRTIASVGRMISGLQWTDAGQNCQIDL